MGKYWQLQEAKARLSELLRRARREGPQEITVRGRPEAVVLSREDYEKLVGPRRGFLDFMRGSPLAGLELEIERDKSPARDVGL